ncbi:MAG: L-2-hydroxyglutarate oxidase, partial [Verrucomicrobia bacterium]|nr:L-2-hydroxyglutarate oxidase [Cytophagales bacterium]
MTYHILIIGGGIVGMATALQLKKKQPSLKIAVLEKEKTLAKHQTGNNSGVIHSGIYYKPGSLKALNCIKGYQQLIDFCEQENVPYDLCGKIIVASDKTELPALQQIYERGLANNLQGLKQLASKAELNEYEPHVNGIAGIFVPQTGIVDYTAVTEKYAEVFQKAGGDVFFNQQVLEINRQSNVSEVITSEKAFQTQLVINCAGLHSDNIAAMTRKIDFRIIPFRGEYFELKPEKHFLVRNLIYPVPDPNFPFLGVHFTRMIQGGVEAGPNAVFAFKKEGYKKTDFNFKDFTGALAWGGFQKVMLK